MRILQARKERGGGVAPRQNNRTESLPPREGREASRKVTRVRGREAKVKAKKAIQESNGKGQDERTNERKRNKE